MDIEFIDTANLKELGNSILENANNYKENIDFIHKRINDMNSKTFEWIGKGSLEFINKVNNDCILYNDIYVFFRDYANFLLDCSLKIENVIKSVQGEL